MTGEVRVSSESDRVVVAGILFKNGYSVRLVRRRKNGKTTEYYVAYSDEGEVAFAESSGDD